MRVTGNKYGFVINKCCASCKYKELTDLMKPRLCTLHNKHVKAKGLCENWEINENLLKIGGYKDGRVKKKEYFKYLIAVREREQMLEDKGKVVKPKTIEHVRENFNKKMGSLFLIK